MRHENRLARGLHACADACPAHHLFRKIAVRVSNSSSCKAALRAPVLAHRWPADRLRAAAAAAHAARVASSRWARMVALQLTTCRHQMRGGSSVKCHSRASACSRAAGAAGGLAAAAGGRRQRQQRVEPGTAPHCEHAFLVAMTDMHQAIPHRQPDARVLCLDFAPAGKQAPKPLKTHYSRTLTLTK